MTANPIVSVACLFVALELIGQCVVAAGSPLSDLLEDAHALGEKWWVYNNLTATAASELRP